MKITVLHGSMRKGNTYHLTREVLRHLQAHPDVQIEEFGVSDLDLPFCRSCHLCFTAGEANCPHYRALRPIAESMEGCDALIVSGVVYSLHLNAAMKNLIDHFSYYFHRPRLFEKRALVITTTAGAAEKTVAKYLASVLGHWGISGTRQLSCRIQTKPFSLTEKQQRKVVCAATLLYTNTQQKRPAAPTFDALAVHNAFRGMSTAVPPISEYDANYWRQTGMAHQVYPRRVNPLKTAFGAMVYQVLHRVMQNNAKGRQASR